MVSYASDLQLMDRLCIDENDSRRAALIEILEGSSRWIDKETGHRFYASTETRYYTADWSSSQALSDTGVPYWAGQRRGAGVDSLEIDELLSVSTLKSDADGDGVYETLWTVSTDYWLGPRNALANGKPYTRIHRNAVAGRYFFPLFENGMQVAGSFGTIAATPADIRELCLMVAEIMARPILDMSIAGVESYKFAADVLVKMKSEDLPPLGQRILDGYRTESLAFA